MNCNSTRKHQNLDPEYMATLTYGNCTGPHFWLRTHPLATVPVHCPELLRLLVGAGAGAQWKNTGTVGPGFDSLHLHLSFQLLSYDISKVAWVEEGGAGLQGVWQWGGWGCVPLATAVLCMEFPPASSSGSHRQWRGGGWRPNSPYPITCMY